MHECGNGVQHDLWLIVVRCVAALRDLRALGLCVRRWMSWVCSMLPQLSSTPCMANMGQSICLSSSHKAQQRNAGWRQLLRKP